MDPRLNMPISLAQFALKWSLQGQECRNVLYMSQINSSDGNPRQFTASDLQTAAAVLKSAYTDAYQDLWSSSAELTGMDCVGNSNVGAGPLIETSDVSGGYPFVGGNTGGVTANNVTLAVRLGTGLGGRGNHGRFYFVGIGPGLYDSTAPNKLKAGAVGDFATANAAFLSECTGIITGPAQFDLCVASFVVAGTDRIPAVFHTVTDVSLSDTTFDSQRRRLPGRGV